jgi:hypothetical protein
MWDLLDMNEAARILAPFEELIWENISKMRLIALSPAFFSIIIMFQKARQMGTENLDTETTHGHLKL